MGIIANVFKLMLVSSFLLLSLFFVFASVPYEPYLHAPSVQSVDSNELCFYDGSSWTGLKTGGACS